MSLAPADCDVNNEPPGMAGMLAAGPGSASGHLSYLKAEQQSAVQAVVIAGF